VFRFRGEAVGPDWHLDHVVPLAAGGDHSYANTQVSYSACNLAKGASTADRAAGPGTPGGTLVARGLDSAGV
jgi:5-methylcytosine-specific restriction endonuclease McrA